MVEKKLKKLFDYQRFEQNEKLEKLIQETESRYTKELSEEDLSLVTAAGDIIALNKSDGALGGVNNVP